ncbi:MAG: hypothetical protein KC619_14605 [Myxococcales bacterium]|nr:hypothetical protein [Myxococcales bacterium]
MDDDNIFDRPKRFEIFVPSPKARINLGSPNLTEKDEGPFGYTGLSLQSDVHLFIDANKHTLFQTGQNYCGQVGGKWLQYSNADMVLSSTANVNLSADKKIVVAAGAGQGQITAKDHGTFPRVVAYNALELHYRVDRIQTSLFEFFHGRREHDPRSALAKAGGVDEAYFDGEGLAVSELATKAGETKGGFLIVTAKSLRELYPPGTEREVYSVGKAVPVGGDPIEWLDPVFLSKVAKAKNTPSSLEYGFSTYFNRFDPYAMIDSSKIPNFLAKGIAKFKNALAALRRFADVALKYANVLTSLPLIKQAQNAMAALDNVLKATWAAYHLTDDVFGYWLPNRSSADTGGRNTPIVGGFVDEAKSGWGARIANKPTADARKQAQVKSADEPHPDGQDAGWDLASGTTYRMTITWDNGSKTDAVVVAASAAAASLSITAPALTDQPESKTLVVRVGQWPSRQVTLGPANTASIESFASALGPIFTSSEATVAADASSGEVVIAGMPLIRVGSGPSGATGLLDLPVVPAPTEAVPTPAVPATTVTVNGEAIDLTPVADDVADIDAYRSYVAGQLSGKASVAVSGSQLEVTPDDPTVTLVDSGDTRALLGRMGVSSGALANTGDTLSLAPPHLSSTGEQQELALTIDGTTLRVQLHARTNLHAALSAIPQVTLLATLSGSGNAVTVTSKVEGLASNVKAAVVSDVGWTFAPSSKDAHGVDGAGPKLTLDELMGLIPSLDGASASKSGSQLVLTASTEGTGSHIEASGNLANLVFGSNAKSETITDTPTDAQKASAEDNYKQLISWNHELQKLPEDTRNLTRPVTNAISDAVAAISSLEAALESTLSVVGGGVLKGLPQPPESIGLIAREGIALGTTDRIVGSGGKGIVFIADGGSGTEDHAKFTPKRIEEFVNAAIAWDPIDKKWNDWIADPADPAEGKPPSLGFRVYSDSAADLMGTYSAQLLALGRGKLAVKTADKQQYAGVGIARVMGSHAVEVAGFRRVVVDARNPGTADDDGGRVDVLGQTIFVGGFNLAGTMKDFESTASKGAGLEPLQLHTLAGAEHVSDKEAVGLAGMVQNLGWTKELRDKHTNTNFIRIHAAKEATTVVGGFMLHVTEKDGFAMGSRDAKTDPAINALDKALPGLVLDGKGVAIRQTDKGPAMILTDKSSIFSFGEKQPNIVLDSAQAKVQTGDGKSLLALAKTQALFKHDQTKVTLRPSGAHIAATQLTLAGKQVKIG